MNVVAMPGVDAARDAEREWFESTRELEAQVVFGCILNAGILGAVVGSGLGPEHFSRPDLANLWNNILSLTQSGRTVSAMTVLQDGELRKNLMSWQGNNQTIVPATAPDYARMIMANWSLRAIIDAADAARLSVTSRDVHELVAFAIEAVDAVRDTGIQHQGAVKADVATVARMVSDAAEQMASGAIERPPSTGIAALDARLPMRGLAAGSLHICAGRTGMGKTLLASSIAGHVARMEHGAAYFSLEVPSTEIAARIMSSIMGEGAPDYGSILAGEFDRRWQEHLHRAADRMQGWPLHIDDSAGMTMADIAVQAERAANRMAKKGHRLRLVAIDHAQIVKPSQRYAGNRVGELGEIANAGKVMAKKLQCTVMLCSQLNRSVESRDDKRPTLADLRASGEVEEAADAVMLLYREAYYIGRSPEFRNADPIATDKYEALVNALEINVDKSRQGKPGVAHVWCDPGRSIVCDRQDDRR
jgi:replicative DNA helicase